MQWSDGGTKIAPTAVWRILSTEPHSSKSECIRFVHSRGYLPLVFSGNAFDCSRDLGASYTRGSLYNHGPFWHRCRSTSETTSRKCFRLWLRVHLSCTSPQARSIGFGRGQYVGNHNQRKAGVVMQPLMDCFGFMNTVVIHQA